MNSTQIQTTLAPIIAFIAGLLAGKNVFGWDIGTWTTVVGAIVGVLATIWGAMMGTKTNIVSSAAGLAEVKSITLDRTQAGTAALNEKTPSNVQSS